MTDTVFNFKTNGADLVAGDLQKIQALFNKSSEGVLKLSKTLGSSFSEAQKLSKSLGISGDKAAEAVTILRELSAVGADNATKFSVLSGRISVTTDQFQRLNKEAGKSNGSGNLLSKGGLGGVVQGAGQLFLAFQGVSAVLQGLQAGGKSAYDALIGSNEKLNAQLLQAQTTLAATSQISQGGQLLGGVDAINASRDALQAALKQIEKDTESLVGVTSEQVNQVFSIALSNANDLVGQSQKFADPIQAATELTKGFSATLGTLGVPLDQARQEINSILKGQIDNNSIVAKSLGLTNEQVRQYKQQGVLVDELNKRFGTFVEGNKLAANSIDGISSNILDAFQRISREIGQPLLQPTIDGLQKVYDFIKQNEDAIRSFASSTIEGLSNFFGPILTELGRQFEIISGQIRKAFADNGPQIKAFLDVIGPLLQGAILLTVRVIGFLQQKFIDLANTPLASVLREGIIKTLGVLNSAIEKANFVLEKLGLAASSAGTQLGNLGADAVTELNRGTDAGKAFANEFSNLKITGKPLEDLGETADALQKKLDGAFETLESGAGGDSGRAKQAADDIISLTQTQLEQGNITAEAAIANLEKVAANTKILPDARLAAEKAITQIVQQEGERRAKAIDTEIKRTEAAIASQQLSEAQGDRKLTDLKIEQLKIRAEAQRKVAESAGIDSQAGQAAIQQEKSLQAEILKIRAEFQQREEQRKIKAVETEARKATDVAKLAEQQRLNALQQLENQGILSKKEIEERKLAITEDRIKAEIAAAQKQITALSNLPAPKDPEKRAERESQIRQLQLQRASLTQQLLQNEGQRQEALRQAVIDGIKRQVKEQEIASSRVISGLNREKSAQDAIANSIDRRQKLLQASQSLEKAVGDARLAGLEQELTAFDRAAALRQQLATTEDPEKRRIIEEQLARFSLSAGQSELEIAQKRQEIENRIATQKLESLRQEQSRQRVSLELDLQRQQVAAKRAVIEAKIAEAQAKQQVAAAQGALAEAKQIKDPVERESAVNAAQSQIETAQQGLDLSQTAVKDAEQGVKDQAAIAQKSKQTLAVQQGSELATAQTAENTRQIDQALALADSKAADFAAKIKQAADDSQRIKDNLAASNPADPAKPQNPGLPIPRLFTGGDVLPNQPVIVGDGPGGTIGPNTELFVPKVAGRILNANQTRDILATLPQFTRPSIAVAPSTTGRGQSMNAVVEELRSLRQLVKNRPVVPTKVEVNHLGDPRNPRTISYNTMHDLLRMQHL